jgi:hypothetical protein
LGQRLRWTMDLFERLERGDLALKQLTQEASDA